MTEQLKTNLRWITPVMVTVAVFFLGYLIQQVNAMENRVSKNVQQVVGHYREVVSASIGREVTELKDELKETKTALYDLTIEVRLLKVAINDGNKRTQ